MKLSAKQKEEIVTPEMLSFILHETEIMYATRSHKRLTKVFTAFLNGKLYYIKTSTGYRMICK